MMRLFAPFGILLLAVYDVPSPRLADITWRWLTSMGLVSVD